MSVKYLLAVTTHCVLTAFLFHLTCLILPGAVTSQFIYIIKVFTSLLVIWTTFGFTKKYYLGAKLSSKNKAVLITGCDTGFGHLLAKRLDSRGYHVFAGCLFKPGSGAEELEKSCSDRLQTFELDVTKECSVNRALEFINENLGSSKLWAVVNNAGIAKGFGVEFSSVEDFKDTMEVNTFGMMRVTKKFLPLIRRSKGRIVNVNSCAAWIPGPHMTPYCMSKHASAGFTDCLRQEIAELGVKVISIEPEMFLTNLTSPGLLNKRFDWMIAELDEEVKTGYGEKYMKNIKANINFCTKMTSTDVHIVIDDLESAVSSMYPEPIYEPRRNVLTGTVILIYAMLPATIQDLCFRSVAFIASIMP